MDPSAMDKWTVLHRVSCVSSQCRARLLNLLVKVVLNTRHQEICGPRDVTLQFQDSLRTSCLWFFLCLCIFETSIVH